MDSGLSPRLGQTYNSMEPWMQGNTYLPQVTEGDTVAYEFIDTRGRWKWALGVVKDQPIPRLTNLTVWRKKNRDLNDKEKMRSEELLLDINARTADIEKHKSDLEAKTNHILVKRAHIAVQSSDAEERMKETHRKLEEAKTAVRSIADADIREMRSYNTPPAMVRLVLEAVLTVLNSKTTAGKKKEVNVSWDDILAKIREKDFIQTVANFDVCDLHDETRAKVEAKYIADPKFTYENARKASKAAGPLYLWVLAQLALVGTAKENRICEDNVKTLKDELDELTNEVNANQRKIGAMEEGIVILNNEYEDLMEEQLEDDTVSDIYLATSRRGNVTQWYETDIQLTILSTSILNNMGVQEFTVDPVMGKVMRITPDKHSDIQTILVTARKGHAGNAEGYMGASLPTGFKLGLPPGASSGSPLFNNTPTPRMGATNNAAEMDALKAQVDDLKAKLQELENNKPEDGGEHMDADATLRGAGQTTAAFESGLDVEDGEGAPDNLAMAALEAEIERLKEELDKSNATAKASEAALADVEEDVQKALADLNDAKQQADKANDLKRQSDAEMESLREQLEALKSKSDMDIVALQGEIADAKDRLEEAQKNAASSNDDQLTAANAAKEAAGSKVAELQDDLTKLSATNSVLEDKLKAIQAALDEANATIAELRAQMDTNTAANAALASQLGTAQEGEASANDRATTNQNKIDELLKDIANLTAQKKAADAVKADSSSSELIALQASLDAANATIASNAKSLRDTEAKLSALQTSITTIEKSNSDLTSQLHLLEEKKVAADGRVEDCQQEINRLKKKLTEVKAQRELRNAAGDAAAAGSDDDGAPVNAKTNTTREVVKDAASPLDVHGGHEAFSDSETSGAKSPKKSKKSTKPESTATTTSVSGLLPFDETLSAFQPQDVSYTLLIVVMQFCVSFATSVPSAIGAIESTDIANTTVFYANSSYMGALYALLRGTQAFLIAFLYLIVAPKLLRSTVADWKDSLWSPSTTTTTANPIDVDRHSGGSVQSEQGNVCPSGPGHALKKFSHYMLLVLGISASVVGALLTLTGTPLISGPLLGAGELFVFFGSLIMLNATGMTLQGGSALLLSVAYIIAPIVAYFCVPAAAASAGVNHLKMLGVYVDIVAVCALVWLAMAPYKMRGHRRVAPVGSNNVTPVSRSLETSTNPTSPTPTSPTVNYTDMNTSSTDVGQVAVASCPFSAFVAPFPSTWSGFGVINASYTQPLVAAGTAGAVVGIAFTFAESAFGIAISSAVDIPDQANSVYVGQCVALMWLIAGLNIAFTNRGVSRVLELMGYPNTPNAPRDLLTSPMILKVLTALGVLCCTMASIFNISQSRILVSSCMFGLAIGYSSQELLCELFPAQFYRPAERGLQLYGDNFAKSRITAPFAFLLVCATMFAGFVTNAFVIIVGATQKITKDDPLGASPQVPSIILTLMCIIPALMVIRGFVPYFKKEVDADRHQSESEPLI